MGIENSLRLKEMLNKEASWEAQENKALLEVAQSLILAHRD